LVEHANNAGESLKRGHDTLLYYDRGNSATDGDDAIIRLEGDGRPGGGGSAKPLDEGRSKSHNQMPVKFGQSEILAANSGTVRAGDRVGRPRIHGGVRAIHAIGGDART
jgi:hypothetical protein